MRWRHERKIIINTCVNISRGMGIYWDVDLREVRGARENEMNGGKVLGETVTGACLLNLLASPELGPLQVRGVERGPLEAVHSSTLREAVVHDP